MVKSQSMKPTTSIPFLGDSEQPHLQERGDHSAKDGDGHSESRCLLQKIQDEESQSQYTD